MFVFQVGNVMITYVRYSGIQRRRKIGNRNTSGYCCRYERMKSCESGWMSCQTSRPKAHHINCWSQLSRQFGGRCWCPCQQHSRSQPAKTNKYCQLSHIHSSGHRYSNRQCDNYNL